MRLQVPEHERIVDSNRSHDEFPAPASFPPVLPMRRLLTLLALLAATTGPAGAQDARSGESHRDPPGWKLHRTPSPLSPDAVTTGWPGFLGPLNRPVTPERPLRREFPESGPPLVWEYPRGSGYASPAIAGERVILFHRVDDQERIDCLHAETGRVIWRHSVPVQYTDDFGYSNGPRAGPVIEGDLVYTFGVASRLTCLRLEDGSVVWEVDCASKYGVPQYFFGSGSSPLVHGDLLILNAGGSENRCVIAFDRRTGEEKWITRHEWGQSYASPIAAPLHGRERILVFAGGKSRPATGGLLSLDPATGVADDVFPWRAQRYSSVNASTPVLCGENRVFISQAYVDRGSPHNGGAMLTIGTDGAFRTVWTAPEFGCHWMTPVYHDGFLYAFSGEKEQQCDLVCYDAATGALKWKERMIWEYRLPDSRTIRMSPWRGSLLHADGRFLCLGEWGTLCWLDLSPDGPRRGSTAQLFVARETWTLPAISRGLLYVCQNEADLISGLPPRLLCYDLRGESPE